MSEALEIRLFDVFGGINKNSSVIRKKRKELFEKAKNGDEGAKRFLWKHYHLKVMKGGDI